MPANNFHLHSVPCAFIGTPLDADCKLVEAAPVWVVNGIAKWTPTPNSEDGVDLTRKDWTAGRVGPVQKGARSETNWAIEGEFTGTDWKMFSAMTGMTEAVDGAGNTVGSQRDLQRGGLSCVEAGKPKFALAIAVGVAISDAGCVEPINGATRVRVDFWPLVTNIEVDLPEYAGEAANIPFTMEAYGSPDENAGPLNLWPAAYTPDFILPGKVMAQAFVDPGVIPTVDYQSTMAMPAPRVPV